MNVNWQPGGLWMSRFSILGAGILSLVASAQPFVEVSTSLPTVFNASTSWGDYDNDGDTDLLLTGDTGSTTITRVYRNNNGAFVDSNAGLPGLSEGTAIWADYNGDGWLDFGLTGNGTAGKISRIYRNNGNGTFTNINANLPGLEGATLAWGDYDNDGDLDLFLTGYTGSTYIGAIYRNDGGDTFTDSGITTIRGGAAGAAAWADFDNDGDLDLLFAGFTLDTTSGQSSRLYRNNNGTFTNITSITLTAMSETSVAWGDYDNDDDLDILMAGSSISGVQSFPTLRLYRNNTSGASFTSIITTMGGAQNCSVAWGDYDNDGDLDAAIAGYNPSFQPFAKIFRNDGGGIFTDTFAPLTGVVDASLAWCDYDNDEDLDLVLTGRSSSTNITKIYRNETPSINFPPFAPFGLSSFVSEKTATLNWSNGGDFVQAGGMTFNLRVGTSPGTGNIMNAMANSTDGFRRVARIGNVSGQLSWSLKLPVGTYYWSVQAVDHGFAGSPFASEEILVVPVQAPNVATLPATNVTSSSGTLRATANPNGDATSLYFEYGTTTNYGSATPPINLGNGVNELNASDVLTNLLPGTTYNFRAVATNNLGTSYGTNRSFITPTFLEVTSVNFLGVGNGSIAWGDYNNDGYQDLLVAGGNSTGIVTRVYRNLSGTNFVEAVTNLAGINNGTVAWGDYDNDGDLDVLLTGNSTSSIYRNDGGDVFTDINAGLPGLGTGSSAPWADMDSDGDLDFVLTGGGSTTVRLHRNDGNDQFTSVTNSLPPVNDSALAWADYDKDGDMDLLMTGYNFGAGGVSEMTRIYRNDGRGNFTNSNLSFQSVNKSAVSWGDYDNDGDLDFLLCGAQFSTRYTMLYSNSGAGTFTSIAIAVVPKVDQGDVSWGDYDNDGMLDILIVGQASTGSVARVFRSDVNVYRDSGAVLPALSNARAAWGDFDNDGRLDILQMGYTGSNYVTKLFRNVSLNPNTPPSAPTALTTTVANNAVLLGWGAAPDANQSGGLSYNLRIGTAPGLSDVVGPMANAPNGFRRVPKLGNTNLRQSWTITNLLVGTYYWSVQAMDHADAGSPFSTNGSFTITTALLPPTAITKPATNISLASVTMEGLANPKGSPTKAFFQYGTTTNFGNATVRQDIGNGITNINYAVSLTTLTDGTTYYFRLAASNINATVFGATLSFTTGLQFSNVVTALPFLGVASYNWAGSAVWGDYDNDGDFDVALTGYYLPGTQVFRNDGGDVFTLAIANLPPAFFGVLEWGDYDNDGHLDLLIGGSPSLTVMHNSGNGSFSTNASSELGFYGPTFATWVDYDNDGDLDIAYAGDSPTYGHARIFRNDGGTFVTSAVSLPELVRGWMAWADYDNDGDSDLAISGQFIVTNYYVLATRIYRNDGHGDFTDIQAPLTGLENSRIAWGDYDNDGDLDLICTGNNPGGSWSILYRNDNGSFVDANAGLPGTVGPAGWTDYDNDGDLDMYLEFDGYYYSTNRIFRNDGGALTDSGKQFVGSTAWYVNITSMSWADYDRDGDLDVLVGNVLHRNNNLVLDALPSAPTGLINVRTGNIVSFQWNAPTDANQSGGLTYNLQIGTAPGSYNVLSPSAGANGLRRVAKPGIASHPIWKLELPVGTYYWRVQAIDHTLAGSAFSSEASFTVPVQSPWAETSFSTTNSDGYPRLNGFVNPNGLTTTVYFDYGVTTNFASRTTPQAAGSGTARLPVSADLSSLAPEGSYYYRLAASNILGVSFGITRSVWQPWFTDRTPAYGYMTGASWADADNDGDFDLSIQAYYGTQIYRNDSATLTNLVTELSGITFSGIGWGDYDKDGDVDLFVTGRDANFTRKAKLFRNDGNHTYTEVPTPVAPGANGTVNWADLDNDGDLDLIVTGENTQGGPFTQVCLNEGDSFALSPTMLPGLLYGSVACADYDNDGDVDILLGGQGQTAGLCKLFSNDGNANFSDSGAALPNLREVSLVWGDFDNDADLDILVNGRDETGTNFISKVLRNNSGMFTDANVGLPGLVGYSAWFDYDNDGRLDIILGGSTNFSNPNITRIFRNMGGGIFSDSGLQLEPAASTQIGTFPADYDNDGDQDLMFAFGRLLRNENRVTNSAPATPSGLSSSVSSNSARLAWMSASDPNQAGGLSYNVRVGTSVEPDNVLSSMSLADGRRLLPEFGNAFARTNLTLRALKVGSYYWSVQAIDHARIGSAFSTNGSFVIPAQAPSVTSLAHSNLTATGITLVGRVNPNGAATIAFYQYGFTTNYGTQTSVQPLGSGADSLPLTQNLSGLSYVTTYHYRLVTSNSFGIMYGPDRVFTTPQFSIVDLGLPPSPGAFAPGDDDNDGDLDFVMAIDSGSQTLLFQNSGSATFTTNGVTFPALNGASFDWGDYDRDGDLDLLLSGWGSAGIYRNDGTANFTNLNASLPGGWGTSRWGDYDNDGDLDILASRIGSTQVYQNNGNGQFDLASTPSTNGAFAVWADYDNDSDLDFVVCGVDVNYTRAAQLFRNDGAAGFVNSGVVLPNLSGLAAWGDYDNTGSLDLLLNGATNDFGSGLTRLYRNNGNGTFTEVPTALPDVSANLLWADYDNDGNLDVLMSGQINFPRHASVYRNDGNGVFTDIGAGMSPTSGDGLACGDFDKDGDLDFLVSGYVDPSFDYVARLYRNNNAVSNPPPTAPTGLTAARNGTAVTLSWSPAVDANQSGGLSYNLRLGTTPGGNDIVSPTVAPNGWQRVPRMGNVQENLHWSLTNLTAGTYYWSVQAVDNSFAGSAFASEAVFSTNSIPNSPPVAISQLLIAAEDALRAITLSATDADGQALTYNVTTSPTNGLLTGWPPNVSYRPNSNFFGADRLWFQANDGFTNSLPGMVSIIVTQVHDVAYSTLAIQKQTNGQPRVTMTGEPFERYELEASTDLVHWVALTNMVSSNGIMAVIDVDTALYPKRFYRAALSLPPANVSSPQKSPGGAFQFNFGGELARRYDIQTSTNLVNWVSLTNVLLTESPTAFTDPIATNYPRRFYRVLPIP